MATNANLDWTQSAAAGYVPACASGNINAHSTDDAEMSFLLQRDASASDSRFQDGSFREYDAIEGNGNAHEDSQANVSTPSTVKPSEHLTSEDPRIGLTIPSTPPRDYEQQHQSWSTSPGELQNFDGMPGITGTGRKSIAKPKPEPSNPRLFRPFTIDESKDTMMLKWKTPPVIGSYMLFPNKRLRYVPLPPKLEMVREKLFRIEKPILLKNSQEVANYIPHITNLWRKTVQRVKSNEDGLQVEYWHCRSKKRKDYSRKDAVRGLRNRERKADNMFGRHSLSHVVGTKVTKLTSYRRSTSVQNEGMRDFIYKTRQHSRKSQSLGRLQMYTRVGAFQTCLCRPQSHRAYP